MHNSKSLCNFATEIKKQHNMKQQNIYHEIVQTCDNDALMHLNNAIAFQKCTPYIVYTMGELNELCSLTSEEEANEIKKSVNPNHKYFALKSIAYISADDVATLLTYSRYEMAEYLVYNGDVCGILENEEEYLKTCFIKQATDTYGNAFAKYASEYVGYDYLHGDWDDVIEDLWEYFNSPED